MTTTPDPAEEIVAAERRAAAAKERLSDDLHRIQAKLSPKSLARDAKLAATERGQEAVRVAKANPAPIAGAVALGGLFLLRHRIAALFRRKKKLTVPAQPRTTSDAPPVIITDQGTIS